MQRSHRLRCIVSNFVVYAKQPATGDAKSVIGGCFLQIIDII